ncbi:hypothetical protein ACS0TY_003243 [Phlomoides rotata]
MKLRRCGERLHYRRPSQAMSRACSKTPYPNLCVKSLLNFPGRALYFAYEISSIGMNPHARYCFSPSLLNRNNQNLYQLCRKLYTMCRNLYQFV